MRSGQLRKAFAAFAVAMLMLASLALAFTKGRAVFIKPTTAAIITPSNQMPRVVLWAWERPVDLRFIDPRKAGVAFLARTIHLRGNEAVVRERLQSGIAELRMTKRLYPFHYPFAPPEVVEFYRSYYGPTNRAFATSYSSCCAFHP